jgi:hypothetical protein
MLDKMLFKDTDGKKSLTATAFVYGFLVLNFKLLFSGITLGDFQMAQFSGVEYGAALAALGGIYVLRRNNNMESNNAK